MNIITRFLNRFVLSSDVSQAKVSETNVSEAKVSEAKVSEARVPATSSPAASAAKTFPLRSLFSLGVASGAAATLALTGALATAEDEAVSAAVEKQLRAMLTNEAVGLTVESVSKSRIEGMYRVQLDQGPQIYATESGDYFILGDLFSVGPDGFVNVAEQQRSVARKAAIDAVPEANKIVFPAQGETLAYVTVFTDVSCFYCQKLHKEVPELNRRGIEIRYLAYPRQGIGSPGFRQLASAWCADDRQSTLTRLKNREELPENVCPGNPIAEQFELGQQLGVRGTPALIMPSGEMVPGYRSADDLISLLGVDG